MKRFLAFLCLTVPVFGCGDANGPTPPGSMRFDYSSSLSGPYHGTFDVTGSLDPDSDNWYTGAIAQRGNNQIGITGTDAPTKREFEFTLVGVTAPGTYTTCQERTTGCVFQGHFWPSVNDNHSFGWGLLSPLPYPEVTVTVTELTNSRIRGSFTGVVVGNCTPCNTTAVNTITITAGTFDTPFWK
jgi:hypothetical protein